MPDFQYISKDINGKVYKGILTADSTEMFYRALRERNQFCVSVKDAGRQKGINLSSSKIKLKELSIFCRQFSTMLNAGLSVIKTLDILYQQTTDKRTKENILGVYETVQKGESLSKAMKGQKNAFPLLLLNMVAAGEASGTLDAVMKRMSEYYEKDFKLQNKIRQAMIYPLVLLILTVAIVAVLLAFVVPTFVGMFKQIGGDLPAPTKILLSISNAITGYWYLLLLGIGFIVLVVYIAFKSPKVRIAFDKFKLRMPVFGKLQIIVESAQFARTLASLFSSGLPIIQALDIVGKVIGNRFIKEKLFDVTEDVKKGLSLSIAMRKIALFPLMLCSMLSIGEESGNMDEILNKTAEFYDEESDTSIQRMVALIEPLMIVLMGAMVGFIVISIIMPVFSMYNQINSTGGA